MTEVAKFPITPDTVLKRSGTHNGVRYEVVNHSRYDSFGRRELGTWCYYLYVSERMLPEDGFKEFWLDSGEPYVSSSGEVHPNYDYYSARFSGANWHGGVTFYEKLGGVDGASKYVKIGCDFSHLWDEDQEYSYDDVESEAKATIEQLCEMYAFYRRCPWNGKYQPESEMVEYEGTKYSSSGLQSKLGV
jgi:hypothetical protein